MANVILKDNTGVAKTYTDVNNITVPKVGGGTETFISPFDATADSAKILSGYTAYVADGSKATGTIQNWNGEITIPS